MIEYGSVSLFKKNAIHSQQIHNQPYQRLKLHNKLPSAPT